MCVGSQELVRPDDGAKWLRDKFAIQKRIFLLEKRLQNEAFFDPRSVKVQSATDCVVASYLLIVANPSSGSWICLVHKQGSQNRTDHVQCPPHAEITRT
jgi:hypothetical protein